SYSFFHETPDPEIYTLSLHDALPISSATMRSPLGAVNRIAKRLGRIWYSRPRVVSGVPIIGFVMIWTNSAERLVIVTPDTTRGRDRKSTRLNSSHVAISYAVFCLKKK